jgi:molybdopterin-synthase adenylyltransferase
MGGTAGGAQSRNRLWMSAPLVTALAKVAVVIVGCGGNGALVAIGPAHLGVRRLTLCDPDRIEKSNLNRSPAAQPADVGRLKVDVLRDYLRPRFPRLKLAAVTVPSPNDAVAAACTSGTAVFGCLDTVHARLELDVLCRSRRRLLIDAGTGFAIHDDGAIVSGSGQVLISRPDGPCLQCLGFTPAVQGAGYFVPGDALPQASSLLLNSVVSALAIECLLDELGRRECGENRICYNATARTLTAETLAGEGDCPVCGADAATYLPGVGNWRVQLRGGAE